MYEAPNAELTDETTPAPVRVPVSDYIMAVISGLFVTFGVILVAGFSPVLLGDLIKSVPRPVFLAVPVLAIGLGILSAWQSVRQARRKALEKSKAR